MKRRVYSLTALLLALSLIPSCSDVSSDNKVTSSDESTTEQTVSDRLTELGERNFESAPFTILDEQGHINVNVPDETQEGEIVNDAIRKRNQTISDRYNIKFEYAQSSSGSERAQFLRQSVLAQDNEYDLMFSPIPTGLGSLATEGILANLCDMEYLSLDEKWWSPLIYENLRIDGKMYYTTGDISPISYRGVSCYYANETLMEQYKISKNEIYTAVKDGKWTLDMLNELAGELDMDLNQDDTLYADDDFFGILNENNGLTAACFLVASGVNLSSIDDDGELFADLNTEKATSVVEKLSKVLSNAPRKDQNALHDAFKSDRVVFLMHYGSSGYTRYRDMNSNYIMLPLPKYDEKQENYRSLMNTWMNAFVCVPVTADTERAGFIMEAMAYLGREVVRPAAYENAMKVKGTRNDEDTAMIDIIFDSLYLDFNSFMDFGGCLTPIADAIFNGGSYTSSVAALTDKMNAEMENFNKAWIGENN